MRSADFQLGTWNLELLERQLATQPMQLGFVETLPGFVHYTQRLGQHNQPLLYLSGFSIRLGQQGKKIRSVQLCPRCPPGNQTLAYLDNPLLPLSLLGQRPAPQDHSVRQPKRKPLLGRECNGRLCPLPGCLPLPAVLMEGGSKVQGHRQAKGVRDLLRQDESFVAPLQGQVRIAKTSQGPSRMTAARHSWVLPVEESMETVLPRIMEGNALLQMFPGTG